ncbi:LamG-like jellyroll fold domain-containing protein [Carboxylicivirga caseinilyticus]|uniref:LamG-like jellyroll fold domain-containing protein n=1 Tax=Carboxylicivirga caseinilyticus TaxID=3417572 RepID=UPI003D33D6E4|nr:cadherin-like beta sandwich domain-containing protein [Marinilabiliaceae bacterium A049]
MSLSAQTLKHSYTFEDGTYDATTVFDQEGTLNGTFVGDKISVADGKCIVSGATASTDGYIQFDPVALALNTYSAITLEAFVIAGNQENVGKFTMITYYGTSTAGSGCLWYQPTRSGNQSRVEVNNTSTTITASLDGTELDDGKSHHVVCVLNGAALTYYLDGNVVAEISTAGADYISTIGTDVAYLFKGVWNDPNYNGKIDEFNIYDGAMDATTVMSRFINYVGEDYINANLASLSADKGVFDPAFDPAEVDYYMYVPYGTTQSQFTIVPEADVATYLVYDINDGTEFTNDLVTYEAKGIDIGIEVTALSGTTKTYYVSIYASDGTDDASLKDIQLSVGALDPVFNPETKAYEVIVPEGSTSVDVTGVPNYPDATVSGNGAVSLTNGSGSVTLGITSQDTQVSDSYSITFVPADGTNYAMSLPGVNGEESNIDISGLNLSTLPYTIEMWFKPEAIPQPDYAALLINANGSPNDGICYVGWQTSYDALRLNATGDGDGYAGPTVTHEVTDGWHHVAAIVTEKSRTLILDGIEYTEAANFTPINWSENKTYIGTWDGYWSRTFQGLVDDVKIWNDSISPELLSQNKYQSLNGDEANLVAYYNFDLNNPSQAVDLSSGMNHGLITGGTYVPSFVHANLEISSLAVSSGKVYPSVSAGQYEYHALLDAGTTSFDLDVIAADATAIVTGDGTITVAPEGSGIVTFTVTSADGKNSQDYTLAYQLDNALTLMHSYTFADGTAEDVVGDADGYVYGGTIVSGVYQAGTLGDYIEFPAADIAINTYPSVTFEYFIANDSETANPNNATMLSYFGDVVNGLGANGVFTSVKSRVAISCLNEGAPYNSESGYSGSDLTDDGNFYHMVNVLTNDSISMYINGQFIGAGDLTDNNKVYNLSNAYAYLCKSGYTSDNTWLGSVYEFNVYSGMMTVGEAAERYAFFNVDSETTDATLADLTIDDSSLEGFNSANLNYTVAVAEGTIPVVAGTVKVAGANITNVVQATTVPGTATIEVTGADGTTKNTYTIDFEIATGIGKDSKESTIKVYPTVTSGEFTVEMDGQSSVISVYNLSGGLVKQIVTSAAREIISLDQNGMYLIKVTTAASEKIFKVFKK